MKILPYLFIALVMVSGALGVYVKNVYALERTITIDSVNYISLQQMGKKYNLQVKEENGSTTLIGESVNLTIPETTNIFTLNGENFIAQETVKKREGESWITAKDWANLFDLSLTHFDKVSVMKPTTTEPTKNDVDVTEETYVISDEWGEKLPDHVKKHGNITKVETPHFDVHDYGHDIYNEQLEDPYKIQVP